MHRRRTYLSAPALVAILLLVASAPVSAAPSVSVSSGVRGAGQLWVGGTVKGSKGARAAVELRVDQGRLRRAPAGRVRAGRFSAQVTFPPSARSVRVRVVITPDSRSRSVRRSPWRTLQVAGVPPAAPLTVLEPGQVTGVSGGQLTLAAGVQASVGQVLVSGPSPTLPLGLLARVASLTANAGGVTAQTEPAAITDVLPAGSVDLVVPPGPRATAARAQRRVSCEARLPGLGGGAMDIDHSASLSAGGRLRASWKWGLPPTLEIESELSQTLTYTARLSAGAAVSCDLARLQLNAAPMRLGSITTVIGGIPVVLTIQGNVFLRGSAQLQSGASAAVSGKLTARAGVRVRGDQIDPTGDLEPDLKPAAPRGDIDGEAQVTIEPTLDAYLYNLAGPSADLSTGLTLTAGPTLAPTWKLTAPITAGARLSLTAFGQRRETGRLEVFSRELDVASSSTVGALFGIACASSDPRISQLRASGISCDIALSVAQRHAAGSDTGDWDCSSGGPREPVICEHDETAIAFNLEGGGRLSCGDVAAATGRVKVVSNSVSCQTALDIMKAYFGDAVAGKCEGNACFIEIRGYTCSANTAAIAERSGVAARCRNGEREIEALV